MKKLWSLIKACMTDNMQIFKVHSKKQSQFSRVILPIILVCVFFIYTWIYANIMMDELNKNNTGYTLISMFAFVLSIFVLIEGIYKSGSLLFNCKDDDLLLSLPIKKSTVLFIRIFKFYVFELLFNALFFIPVILTYIRYVSVSASFYVVTFVAFFLLPIVPIVISSIIGGIITSLSNHFKHKNIAQIVLAMGVLLLIFYFSFSIEDVFSTIAVNSVGINDFIVKYYPPVGEYINLINNFDIVRFIIFTLSHIALLSLAIVIFSKVYFKINTGSKKHIETSKNKHYIIKTNKPIVALIKKEAKRFIASPVFVTNAAFGLVLFVLLSILASIKFDGAIEMILEKSPDLPVDLIKTYIPVIIYGFVCTGAFMSSLTSSMISLEGKSFSILKSLPVSPFMVIISKVLTAVLIMIPFILIGDLIMFVAFDINIWNMLLIVVASIILPLIAETFGIIVNLKYPKMDAENDTEVVKQSMSSTIAVFGGMIIIGLTFGSLVGLAYLGLNPIMVIVVSLLAYSVILAFMLLYLYKKGEEKFNEIII